MCEYFVHWVVLRRISSHTIYSSDQIFNSHTLSVLYKQNLAVYEERIVALHSAAAAGDVRNIFAFYMHYEIS